MPGHSWVLAGRRPSTVTESRVEVGMRDPQRLIAPNIPGIGPQELFQFRPACHHDRLTDSVPAWAADILGQIPVSGQRGPQLTPRIEHHLANGTAAGAELDHQSIQRNTVDNDRGAHLRLPRTRAPRRPHPVAEVSGKGSRRVLGGWISEYQRAA